MTRVRRANHTELAYLFRLHGCLGSPHSTLPKDRPASARDLEDELVALMSGVGRPDSRRPIWRRLIASVETFANGSPRICRGWWLPWRNPPVPRNTCSLSSTRPYSTGVWSGSPHSPAWNVKTLPGAPAGFS